MIHAPSPPSRKESPPKDPKDRWKKEGSLIICILCLVGILTFAETQITHLDDQFPISNAVLVFILINTNLLLLLALILLVFRKSRQTLLRKKNRPVRTPGLKPKLVLAFITLALLPTTVLFYFSIHFISRNLNFWFDAPVAQSLDTSLALGREVYDFIEARHLFFARRAAYHIESQKLMTPAKSHDLTRYTQVIQRGFNLQAVEIYTRDAKRLTLSLSQELGQHYFGILTSNDLLSLSQDRNVHSIIQDIPTGEIIRTIIGIPYGKSPEETIGFLVTTTLLPPKISQQLVTISQGIETFRQLKMLKKTHPMVQLHGLDHCGPACGVLCRVVRILSGQNHHHPHHEICRRNGAHLPGRS